MQLLLIEDDPAISSFVVKGLGAEGYPVLLAPDLATADAHLRTATALALVVLDRGLPDGDGVAWLARRSLTVPVIILTARGEVADRVDGLNAGAVDYIAKPFAFEELVARVRAALRTTTGSTTSVLQAGDLSFDLLSKRALVSGTPVELSKREWTLLELFLRHPGQVLSRAQILSAVWDYSFDPGSNVVDVYVGYLRKKIDQPGRPSFIQTVRGAGYRLDV